MSALRQAAQQALDALELVTDLTNHDDEIYDAIDALRAALAEPVQEPVALDWLHKWANQDDGEPETQWHEGYEAARRVVQIHLTAPPQRKPLTEEEIMQCFVEAVADYVDVSDAEMVDFARAIERAHGIGGNDE